MFMLKVIRVLENSLGLDLHLHLSPSLLGEVTHLLLLVFLALEISKRLLASHLCPCAH